MKKLFIFLLACIALAVLGWFAIYQLKAPAIEADIKKRSLESLESNNLGWVQVDVDGRDVTLSGMAQTERLREHAVATADVYGVRQIEDKILVQSGGAAGQAVSEPEEVETPEAEVVAEAPTEPEKAEKPNDALQAVAKEETVQKAPETAAEGDVPVQQVEVAADAIPYRMNIVRDDAGVYLFDGVVPNPEYKQAVDAHLTSLGADPMKARWRVDMSSQTPPANWTDNTLKGLSALQQLTSGSLNIEGGEALLKGNAATQDASDAAEMIAQELAPDFESMDVAFVVSDTQPAVQKVEPVQMVGSAKYAEKFCQTEFNALLKQESIQFETGSTDLQQSSLQLLQKVVQVAGRCPDHQVQVHGYTDSRGSAANNKKLSQARAEAVSAYLNSLGMDEKRLLAEGYGEANPIASNNTEEGRAKNRRIELIVKGL